MRHVTDRQPFRLVGCEALEWIEHRLVETGAAVARHDDRLRQNAVPVVEFAVDVDGSTRDPIDSHRFSMNGGRSPSMATFVTHTCPISRLDRQMSTNAAEG
jgi:hypothetical protein